MKTHAAILNARGRYIRVSREEAGMTQQELANALDLHRPAVSAIEAGIRDLSVTEAFIVAKRLGVEVKAIAFGSNSAR